MMFRDKLTSKLYAFALAAVFALTLAGCGGGGGSAAVEEEPPPMPTDQEVCEDAGGRYNADGSCTSAADLVTEQIMAAQGRANTAATNARADADAAAEVDHQADAGVAAAVAAANAAAAAAEAANMAAQSATDLAAASALAAQAEAAAGHAATALANAMTAATAAQMAMDYAAAKAATTKSAVTKATAIAAEGAQTTDAGLGGSIVVTNSLTGNAEGAYNLDIERDRMASTVTVTVEGATDADDEDFVVAMDFMDGRTMHTRTHDADDDGNVVEEVVIIGTDIEAPRAVAFDKFQVVAADGSVTTPQMLNARGDGEAVDTDNPADALNIAAGNLGMVKAAAFTAPAGTTETTVLTFQHEVEDTAGTPADESRDAAEIAGTFNGSMGTYRCVAESANCSVTVDTKGVVSAVSNANDWAFIPATGATTDQPDYDYYHYGFWLQKTTDKDGAVTYNEVETFAGSSMNTTADVSSVTGSATYDGDAVGVYVHRTFANNGTSNATSGHFTADASLTATFGQVNDAGGQGTIAPNQLNTLSGTIDNFELSGGEANMWSVAVQGAITASGATATGTAKGGGTDDGSFSAQFHGLATHDHDNDTTTADVPTAPGSVVGEFNASFTNGDVAGAFGARLKE